MLIFKTALARRKYLLGHEQDRGPPKGRLLRRRVEDGDLAVVLSGRKVIDAQIETERHGSKPAGSIGDNRSGWGLEEPVAVAIKADEGEQRLAGGLTAHWRWFVGLEINVYLLTGAEDSSDTRDKLLSVLHQGVDGRFLVLGRALRRVVERFLEIDTLAAKHD